MARAAIFGVAGPVLAPDEAAFLREADPWGVILFGRNVVAPDQLRRLTGDIREALGRDAPILTDQEGGRVARLGAPHWRSWPSVAEDAARGAGALHLRYRLIADELREVGIDVDYMPLHDLPVAGAHDVIGDRAFGPDPEVAATCGRVVCAALLAGGVLPVIKHLPGHGRAPCDSHEALPKVSAPRPLLRGRDFVPFAALSDQPLGMTAHVVYTALDPDRPATLSPACIEVIRKDIGFDGLLISDDLSMKALTGPMAARTAALFAAGCEIALHCNADRAEMEAVASTSPTLSGRAAERAARAEALRHAPDSFDVEAAAGEYAALTGRAGA